MDSAKDLGVLKSIHNLIEYCDNYAKAFESLWKYHKDDPNCNITDFELFKFKARIAGTTPADGNTRVWDNCVVKTLE